jgi:hypothetical protein
MRQGGSTSQGSRQAEGTPHGREATATATATTGRSRTVLLGTAGGHLAPQGGWLALQSHQIATATRASTPRELPPPPPPLCTVCPAVPRSTKLAQTPAAAGSCPAAVIISSLLAGDELGEASDERERERALERGTHTGREGGGWMMFTGRAGWSLARSLARTAARLPAQSLVAEPRLSRSEQAS